MTIENSNNQELPEEVPPTTLPGQRRSRDVDISPHEQESTTKKRKLEEQAAYYGLAAISAPYKKGRLASFVTAEEAFTRYRIRKFISHYNAREKQEVDRTGKPVGDARCEELFREVKLDHKFSSALPYRRRMASLIFLMYQTKMECNELKHTARGMWNHRIAEGFCVWIADRVGGKGKLHETNRELRKEHDEILFREYDRRVKLGDLP